MTISSIAELVRPVNRANPAQLGTKKFNYIDIASIDRETKNVSVTSYIDVSSAPSRARQQLITNDVLVSTVRPNLNAVAIIPLHLNGSIGSTGFCVLRADTTRVVPDYLFYFRAPRRMTFLLLESRRCGVTLVFAVDFPRKRLRLRDLRPVLCVPGTRHHHAAAIRSSVTRRRML
jgi:type I restriction enzyme, S subunit